MLLLRITRPNNMLYQAAERRSWWAPQEAGLCCHGPLSCPFCSFVRSGCWKNERTVPKAFTKHPLLPRCSFPQALWMNNFPHIISIAIKMPHIRDSWNLEGELMCGLEQRRKATHRKAVSLLVKSPCSMQGPGATIYLPAPRSFMGVS